MRKFTVHTPYTPYTQLTACTEYTPCTAYTQYTRLTGCTGYTQFTTCTQHTRLSACTGHAHHHERISSFASGCSAFQSNGKVGSDFPSGPKERILDSRDILPLGREGR